jgi:hypothetical protein
MSASHAVIEPGSRGTVVLAYSGMHSRAASASSFGHSHADCGAVGVRSCGLDVLQLHVCRRRNKTRFGRSTTRQPRSPRTLLVAALSHTAEPPSLYAHVSRTCIRAVLPQMSPCCGQWVRGERVDADHNRTLTTHVRVPPPAPHPHTTSAVPPTTLEHPHSRAARAPTRVVFCCCFLRCCISLHLWQPELHQHTAHTFCSLPKTVAFVAANVRDAGLGCCWLTFLASVVRRWSRYVMRARVASRTG